MIVGCFSSYSKLSLKGRASRKVKEANDQEEKQLSKQPQAIKWAFYLCFQGSMINGPITS